MEGIDNKLRDLQLILNIGRKMVKVDKLISIDKAITITITKEIVHTSQRKVKRMHQVNTKVTTEKVTMLITEIRTVEGSKQCILLQSQITITHQTNKCLLQFIVVHLPLSQTTLHSIS